MTHHLTQQDCECLGKGAELECIDNTGGKDLKIGEKYYFSHMDDGFICIKDKTGRDSGGWMPSRFKLSNYLSDDEYQDILKGKEVMDQLMADK